MFGEPIEARLRKLDLCADFAGWRIGDVLHEAWIVQRIGRVREYEKQTHRVGSKITGFTICPGNTLMMRAYDKVAELNVTGREQKREIEYSFWKREGWQFESVTRIEFQFRSTVLRQFEARNLDTIAIPNSEVRRARWEIDPHSSKNL